MSSVLVSIRCVYLLLCQQHYARMSTDFPGRRGRHDLREDRHHNASDSDHDEDDEEDEEEEEEADHDSSEGEFEDCRSESVSSLVSDRRRMIPRQPSVILRDGRRVRRSVTMTSLRGRPGGTHDGDGGTDVEQGLPTSRRRSGIGRLCTVAIVPITFLWRVLRAPGNRGLIKCVVAYFLASLAVFVPQFADLLGHGDGKHFVATCTVYFHPSRSTGSMIQATLYALVALAWAVFVSVSSMATAIGFNQIKQRNIGHVVVLLVWVCGGVGYIGYWKQRMGDPTVGVAASMASMVIFFNITREGSLQLGQFSLRKVLQYFFIIVLGLVISNVVNYVLWPVSASHNLKKDMTKTTRQFSQFLGLVTRRFLQQTPSESLERSFAEAVKANQSVFASLQKNLKESRYEYHIKGREGEYTLLARITRSMNDLAQHLNGLKSSCDAQIGLMQESDLLYRNSDINLDVRDSGERDATMSSQGTVGSAQGRRADLLVSAFIYHLGPPMKSLAFTTKQALGEMPFTADHNVNVPPQLFINIDRALSLYAEAREGALQEMYEHHATPRPTRKTEEVADREEIAASMDYFSFSLQEFVCETRELMYILKELEAYRATSPGRTWRFLKFWQAVAPGKKGGQKTGRPSAVDKEAESPGHTWISRWYSIQFKLWQFLRGLRNKQFRFAVKVGVGAALFASPAMIDSLRPIFVEWRLEWGLLSFFIILNSSVGGTYSAAFWRVVGSALGTGLAMIAWTLFPGQKYALAPIGACIAAPCMYMIVTTHTHLDTVEESLIG